MPRTRQVRFCYPQAYFELALLLANRHGARVSSVVLGLPLSTFYRWRQHRAQAPRLTALGEGVGYSDGLSERIAECERMGFDVRGRVRALEPSIPARASNKHLVASARAPVQAQPDAVHAHAAAVSIERQNRIRATRRAIDERYYTRLSCSGLARIAGMSRFDFIRTFTTHYGISPYRYLLHVRIRHAKDLLENSRQPLDAIATAVGFDSPSSLSRAFRRVERATLSSYYLGTRLGAGVSPANAAQGVAAVAA